MAVNLFHSPLGLSCIEAFHCDPFAGELRLPIIRRNRIDVMTVSSNTLPRIDYYNVKQTCRHLIDAAYQTAGPETAAFTRLPQDDWSLWVDSQHSERVILRYNGSGLAWNEINIKRVPEIGRPRHSRLALAFNRRQEHRMASVSYEILPQRKIAVASSIAVDDVGLRSLKRYFGMPDYAPIFALRDAVCHEIDCSAALYSAAHRSFPSDIPELVGDIGFFYNAEPYTIALDALLHVQNAEYREEFTLLISAQEAVMEAPIPMAAHRLWRWALEDEESMSRKEKAVYRAFVQALIFKPGRQRS